MASNSMAKFIKENINAYFEDNGDGTTTVKFGDKPTKMGTSHANFLKQLISKKMSNKKYAFGDEAYGDVVDTLNQIAYKMVKETKITPEQQKILDIQDKLKNKKLT